MTLAQNPKFDFVFLGQSILRYEVPLDIFTTINNLKPNILCQRKKSMQVK